MRHVHFIDATVIHNFRKTLQELKHHRKKVILSVVRPEVLSELVNSGLADFFYIFYFFIFISKDNIFQSFDGVLPLAKARWLTISTLVKISAN